MVEKVDTIHPVNLPLAWMLVTLGLRAGRDTGLANE